jgi:hypothetical protein
VEAGALGGRTAVEAGALGGRTAVKAGALGGRTAVDAGGIGCLAREGPASVKSTVTRIKLK